MNDSLPYSATVASHLYSFIVRIRTDLVEHLQAMEAIDLTSLKTMHLKLCLKECFASSRVCESLALHWLVFSS